jgi:Tfp pilus assembly protein PilX
MAYHYFRRGAALILSMIFVCVFSVLAVAMFSMSGTNVQIASNQHKANIAFANAESGLEVMRYWLNRILIPNTTSPTNYFNTIISSLQYDLTTNNISNVTANSNGSIPPVTLDSMAGQTFSAQIQMHPDNLNILQVSVTGNCGEITRTIQVNFDIKPYEHPIFDYGLATKGPVRFEGNPTVKGVNYNNEADIYIESQNDPLALLVTGNTNFDGDINIGNANANTVFDGDILIGGDQGQTALDNHVFISVDPVDFPTPVTGRFQQYATGGTINALTDTTDNMTLTNTITEAGANPCFEGNIILKGVLFVESPNIVVFKGNLDIKGLIVGDGVKETLKDCRHPDGKIHPEQFHPL